MKQKTLSFLFIFSFLFISCGPSIYIHTQKDLEYKFKRPVSVYIYLPESPSLDQKNLYTFLKYELEFLDFKVVNDIQLADKILFFSVNEKTSDVSSALTLPSVTTTTGQVGNTIFKGTTVGTTTIPYTSSVTVKKIYVDFYDVQLAKEGKFTPVWEGYLGANVYYFEENPNICLRKLLSLYGQNYRGEVIIK